MNAKIAVIIPTFQRIESLKRALHSVRNQTLAPSETIVVDDNIDRIFAGQVRKIVEYFQKYFPVQYIQSNGVGGAEARNIGAKQAASGLLAFLDDDDIWYNNKLEMQRNHILNCKDECEVVLTKQHITTRTPNINNIRGRLPERPEELLFSNYMPTTSTLMIKKNVFLDIGGFDKELRAAQDRDLWLRLLSKYKVCLIKEPLCVVEMAENRKNAISGGENRFIGTRQFYNKWKDHPALTDRKLSNKYWFNYFNILAHRYSERGNNKQAISCIIKSLQYKITPGVIIRLSKFVIYLPFDIFKKKDTIDSYNEF